MTESTLRKRDEISTTESSSNTPGRATPLASEYVTNFIHFSKNVHPDSCNHATCPNKSPRCNQASPEAHSAHCESSPDPQSAHASDRQTLSPDPQALSIPAENQMQTSAAHIR